MPSSRRDRKLARWRSDTRAREAPLDEVPHEQLQRIAVPFEDMPDAQRPVDADAAKLAVRLQDLRRRLRRARWIPWRRRKRPHMQAEIDVLVAQRTQLRDRRKGHHRRL
jgi:hypothetical protein